MNKKTFRLAALVVVSAGLSACGGGGDAGPAPAPTPPAATDSVPASASASVSGFIDYLQALVKSAADTLEPVSLANVAPPAGDSDEPRQLD